MRWGGVRHKDMGAGQAAQPGARGARPGGRHRQPEGRQLLPQPSLRQALPGRQDGGTWV